ncbi:unnamed protein product [Urochloa humidicola]
MAAAALPASRLPTAAALAAIDMELRLVLEGDLPVASACSRGLPCGFLGQIASLFRRRRGALVWKLGGVQRGFCASGLPVGWTLKI